MRFWTEKEIEYLKNHWGTVRVSVVAKALNRTNKAVCAKADRLNLPRLIPEPIDKDLLLDAYARLKSVWKVGKELGISGQRAHKHLKRLGVDLDGHGRLFTAEEVEHLQRVYDKYANEERLEELAEIMGREKTTICWKAGELGLTDRCRPVSERRKKIHSKIMTEKIKKNGHPRGHLGKKHTKEAKVKMSIAARQMWQDPDHILNNKEFRELCTQKMVQAKRDLVRKSPESIYSNCRGGRREDLNNTYFRSSWEANYARYLNLLAAKWEFEPKTFYFEGIRRGVMSYTPDFYLPEKDKWIEVKGWFQSKAKTALKRFYKYYPDEAKKLTIVVDKLYGKNHQTASSLGIENIESYSDIEKSIAGLIPTWEYK